jgi:hypothetical protein
MKRSACSINRFCRTSERQHEPVSLRGYFSNPPPASHGSSTLSLQPHLFVTVAPPPHHPLSLVSYRTALLYSWQWEISQTLISIWVVNSGTNLLLDTAATPPPPCTAYTSSSLRHHRCHLPLHPPSDPKRRTTDHVSCGRVSDFLLSSVVISFVIHLIKKYYIFYYNLFYH